MISIFTAKIILFFFNLKFYFTCTSVLLPCVFTLCVHYVKRSEEGISSSGWPGVSLTAEPALQPQGVDLPSLELCVSLD